MYVEKSPSAISMDVCPRKPMSDMSDTDRIASQQYAGTYLLIPVQSVWLSGAGGQDGDLAAQTGAFGPVARAKSWKPTGRLGRMEEGAPPRSGHFQSHCWAPCNLAIWQSDPPCLFRHYHIPRNGRVCFLKCWGANYTASSVLRSALVVLLAL